MFVWHWGFPRQVNSRKGWLLSCIIVVLIVACALRLTWKSGCYGCRAGQASSSSTNLACLLCNISFGQWLSSWWFRQAYQQHCLACMPFALEQHQLQPGWALVCLSWRRLVSRSPKLFYLIFTNLWPALLKKGSAGPSISYAPVKSPAGISLMWLLGWAPTLCWPARLKWAWMGMGNLLCWALLKISLVGWR